MIIKFSISEIFHCSTLLPLYRRFELRQFRFGRSTIRHTTHCPKIEPKAASRLDYVRVKLGLKNRVHRKPADQSSNLYVFFFFLWNLTFIICWFSRYPRSNQMTWLGYAEMRVVERLTRSGLTLKEGSWGTIGGIELNCPADDETCPHVVR